MKNHLDEKDIEKLEKLNDQLTVIETKIYDLAKQKFDSNFEQMNGSRDNYDLEVEISFYYKDTEIAVWTEPLKSNFLNEHPTYINDGNNHNVTSSTIKHQILNSQKHCWLLHRLYDDFLLPWKKILKIDNISFDIIEHNQYKIAIFQ